MLQRAALIGIVATLMFLPLGAFLALLCVMVLDVSVHDLVTFWGSFNEPAGLLAWWLVAWLPASAYVAILLPDALAARASGSTDGNEKGGAKDCLRGEKLL